MHTSVSDIRAQQQGYTLIELMIAMAVVGVLAAQAIMTFEEYTVRNKVTEGLTLAAPAKQAVSDYYASSSMLPSSNHMAGLPASSSITGRYTDSVEIQANGIVMITYSGAEIKLVGQTLVLTPSASAGGSIKWNCTSGNLLNKYRPAECR